MSVISYNKFGKTGDSGGGDSASLDEVEALLSDYVQGPGSSGNFNTVPVFNDPYGRTFKRAKISHDGTSTGRVSFMDGAMKLPLTGGGAGQLLSMSDDPDEAAAGLMTFKDIPLTEVPADIVCTSVTGSGFSANAGTIVASQPDGEIGAFQKGFFVRDADGITTRARLTANATSAEVGASGGRPLTVFSQDNAGFSSAALTLSGNSNLVNCNTRFECSSTVSCETVEAANADVTDIFGASVQADNVTCGSLTSVTLQITGEDPITLENGIIDAQYLQGNVVTAGAVVDTPLLTNNFGEEVKVGKNLNLDNSNIEGVNTLLSGDVRASASVQSNLIQGLDSNAASLNLSGGDFVVKGGANTSVGFKFQDSKAVQVLSLLDIGSTAQLKAEGPRRLSMVTNNETFLTADPTNLSQPLVRVHTDLEMEGKNIINAAGVNASLAVEVPEVRSGNSLSLLGIQGISAAVHNDIGFPITRLSIAPGFSGNGDVTVNSEFFAFNGAQYSVNAPQTFLSGDLKCQNITCTSINLIRPSGGVYSESSDFTFQAPGFDVDLLGNGQKYGTLVVPPGGFQAGDSYMLKVGGRMTCINNAEFIFRVGAENNTTPPFKPGPLGKYSNFTGFTTVQVDGAQTNGWWELEIEFIVRSVGGAGAAAMAINGNFSYINNTKVMKSYGFDSTESTNFRTDIENTLFMDIASTEAAGAFSMRLSQAQLTKTF